MDDTTTYAAFEELVRRHKKLIDEICMRRSWGSKNRFLELRQDCYVSLWHHFPSLRKKATAVQEAAWVAWQCRSVLSHLGRRRQREVLFLPVDEEMADTVAEPDDILLRETIDELAAQLPPREQRAFLLMADGYTAEELAKEMGIKHRSAVMLRHRIIEKLRQRYNKEQNE